MHPVQGEDPPGCFDDFIDDVGPFLRELETRLHGRAHLQTVSVFGPELIWKPWLREPIFRHPPLDFAIGASLRGGHDRLSARHGRAGARHRPADPRRARRDPRRPPVLDTEHGPIHTFKDHGMHAARGVRRRVFPPHAMGASRLGRRRAAACAGRTAIRIC